MKLYINNILFLYIQYFLYAIYIATEFRIIIDPNGKSVESPTVHCAPDLSTPRRNARKRTIILRAPSPELKAVWQNLLQRQM